MNEATQQAMAEGFWVPLVVLDQCFPVFHRAKLRLLISGTAQSPGDRSRSGMTALKFPARASAAVAGKRALVEYDQWHPGTETHPYHLPTA